MIEIKNRFSGEVIFTFNGDSLIGADLSRANLRRADLAGVDLAGADLAGADLRGANLHPIKNDFYKQKGSNK